MTNLNWKFLVDSVQRSEYESLDVNGNYKFIYSTETKRFLSDPKMIKDVKSVSESEVPFLLIGKLGTGKNQFLQLVGQRTGRPVLDLNLQSTVDKTINSFFGPQGEIIKHPNALIHFDMLDKTADISWTSYHDILLRLLTTGVLLCTDGNQVKVNCRVVIGAEIDLDHLCAKMGFSSFSSLVDQAKNKGGHYRIDTLWERTCRNPECIQNLLTENMAHIYITQKQGEFQEHQFIKIENIDENKLKILQNYRWPTNYSSLYNLVKKALQYGEWDKAFIDTLRPSIFIIWCNNNKEKAVKLANQIEKSDIQTFISEKHMGIGGWATKLDNAIEREDYVLLTITKGMLKYGTKGIYWKELLNTKNRSEIEKRNILFGVVVDCQKDDILKEINSGPLKNDKLIKWITDQQWFEYDPDILDPNQTNSSEGLKKIVMEVVSDYKLFNDSRLKIS
ncbi:hypothetical protein JW865_07115 [Candidatus Bathyarchaeota archaeon]|nr:hypothetical protein [Candidatus Bathyarchaeota archaeon]